jgi:hypothetical protein
MTNAQAEMTNGALAEFIGHSFSIAALHRIVRSR